ncbi:MAG: AAA family ATPase [Tannerella sp.]|nr:MAG: AAA family ATPase [Tannerella sp.]
MTNEEKEMIRVRLGEYCEMKGSQKRAATSLVGVSPATVTQIVTGKWELINEKMWRSIAAQIGVKQTRWNIVETRNYRALSDIFADAQENALVLAVCGEAGTGKSLTAAHYGAENPNVYVLACSEYWNRKTFLRELLRVMGKNPAGDTVGDMVDDVVMALKRRENPLIILDEADKLSDQVMFFFITFYNKLEDYCGIVLMATDYLEKKVRRGLRLNKKGYKEIYSRIGRRFVAMPGLSATDISDVCRANGVEGLREIDTVKKDCEGDLRRVKRKCHAFNRMRRQAEERKEETAE